MASGPFEFVRRAARDYLDEVDRRHACDCCPPTVTAMVLPTIKNRLNLNTPDPALAASGSARGVITELESGVRGCGGIFG